MLWAIGQHLHVCWLNFFDDYPVVTPKLLGPSTKQTLKALVDLLGFDCEWGKMNDFSPCATMLGVEVGKTIFRFCVDLSSFRKIHAVDAVVWLYLYVRNSQEDH